MGRSNNDALVAIAIYCADPRLPKVDFAVYAGDVSVYPTCSSYAVVAIERHGVVKGSFADDMAITALSALCIRAVTTQYHCGRWKPTPEQLDIDQRSPSAGVNAAETDQMSDICPVCGGKRNACAG